jgi:hypothetical protein
VRSVSFPVLEELLGENQSRKQAVMPLLANPGTVYAGLSSTARAAGGVVMNATTGKNVIRQIQTPAAAGHQDFVEISAGAGNSSPVDDYGSMRPSPTMDSMCS